MKPGDIVRNLYSDSHETGLFMGMRTYRGKGTWDYTCAEVMWFDRRASNGDRVSTIQLDLIGRVDAVEGEE